jgi:ABC-type sugar transport system permease subunit
MENIFAYSLIILPLIHFIVFYFYVNIESFFLPFIDEYTGGWTIKNFKLFLNDLRLGFGDSEILSNLKNTLIYFFSGLLKTPLCLIISFFLFKKILGHKFFRILFTLPMIVSTVVFVAIYKNLLSADGPIDELVKLITGKPMENYPLYTPGLATWAIVIYGFWTGFGLNMILYSGSMARIPDSIIEYAKIDGCGFFREMWQIVLPIIWPSVSVTILMSFISVFSATGEIVLFSGGMYDTSTLSYWMYNYVVLQGKYNYAAAFGLLQTVATLPLVIFFRWLSSKVDSQVSY